MPDESSDMSQQQWSITDVDNMLQEMRSKAEWIEKDEILRATIFKNKSKIKVVLKKSVEDDVK